MLRASVFNFERHDILWDSMGHPCKKLSSFDFSNSFCFEFGASRDTTGHNRTSESKVIVVWISSKLLFSFTSVSIYYATQSDIRVKSYCRLKLLTVSVFNSSVSIYYGTQLDIWVKSNCHLNFLRAFVFNYERLHILRDSIGHPSKKLLSFDFSQSFSFQFRTTRHMMGLNGTSV